MDDKLVIEGELSWVVDYEVCGFQIDDDWLENFIDEKFTSKRVDSIRWGVAMGYGKVRITIERLDEGE